MYTGDSLYQVIMNYNYDLFRGDSDISTYMQDHFHKYLSDLENAVKGPNPFLDEKFIANLNEKIPLIKDLCRKIVNISITHRNGFIKESYDKAYSLFNLMTPYFLSRFSWKKNDGWFYRIRQGDFRIKSGECSKAKKADLFHIKCNSRNLIGAYRYSVSGFPCLYLSSGKELCWFECGMPRQFSYCQMIIDEKGENALKLIDFSNRPVDLLSSVHVWLLNAEKDEAEKQKIYSYFMNYIITYPLAAACSVKVKDRGNRFVEEYVIPQMFMQWIRESDKFDGVRYKSSLNSNLVQGMGAVNIALPVKKFRDDGLCEMLTSKITISDIGYLDVSKEFEKYKVQLGEIEDFKNELWSDLLNSDIQGDYEWRLIEVCETVIKTYNDLMNGNYINGDLIFSYISCIYDYVSTIYRSKEIVIKECINRALHDEKNKINPDKIRTHIDTFHSLIGKVVHKHTVFDFGFANLENFEKI